MGFLSPYRVLDLANERGLLAGKMFADLGTDVIQVEPIGGSSSRAPPPLSAVLGQRLDKIKQRFSEIYYTTMRSASLCWRQRGSFSDDSCRVQHQDMYTTRRDSAMDEDWKQAWQPLIDAVGTDFGSDAEVWGADEVERGTVRRFLEPLEFDCPLHYDRATAQSHGYPDILAPYSSIMTFAIPPLWQPGQHIFVSAERDAQPARSPVSFSDDPMLKLMPPAPGFFATDMEIDYLLPVVIGDHLCMRGRKLLSCTPKETSVGRGAFITWESEVLNQRKEVVARFRMGMYQYMPHQSEGE